MVQWACLAGLFLVLTACGAEGTQGRLEVTVTEAGGGRLPCRVHLMVEGKPVYAPGLPRFERDPHFSCPGQFAADVPAGKVSLRIEALAQEDERAGGAILLFNLTEPILIEGVTRDCPSGFAYHERAIEQKAFIEVEKPFWWEAPVHVALGRVDTIGIVCNHFNRAGLLEGEAWGRPRDRARHPAGPLGFALNVMDLYYRHLNLGYQIAASAGSASGVLANPLGYNRAYVQLDRFGYDAWFDGLRQGRNFATMTSSSPPAGSQEAELSLAGTKESRRIGATEIAFDGKSVYVALLHAPGIWHEHRLPQPCADRDVALGWKRPFQAKWRANLCAQRRSDSWDFFGKELAALCAAMRREGPGGGPLLDEAERCAKEVEALYQEKLPTIRNPPRAAQAGQRIRELTARHDPENLGECKTLTYELREIAGTQHRMIGDYRVMVKRLRQQVAIYGAEDSSAAKMAGRIRKLAASVLRRKYGVEGD